MFAGKGTQKKQVHAGAHQLSGDRVGEVYSLHIGETVCQSSKPHTGLGGLNLLIQGIPKDATL